MRLSTFLSKATERIEKKWIKGSLNDGHGGVCSIGALNAVQRKYSVSVVLYQRAERLLMEIIRGHGRWKRFGGIAPFNDSSATTKKEVLSVFTEAQRRAKIQEQEDAKAKV